MDPFTPIRISESFVEALEGRTVYSIDSSELLKINPPKNNDGIDASMSLYRALYDAQNDQMESVTEPNRDVFSTEIWYDEEELKFLYYSPIEKLSIIQRRHVDGFFPQVRIQSTNEYFPDISAGEYVTGGDIWLRNHYFEPIRQPNNGAADWTDPYQMLFNGIETRDSKRTLIQVLFKPAPQDWARNGDVDITTYASQFTESTTEERLYGLLGSVETEPTPQEKDYAKTITKQADSPAFHVNIRFLVIGNTEQEVVSHATDVNRIFKNGYQEVSGQTLKAQPADSPEEMADLLRRVAGRESINMSPPNGFLDSYNHIRKTHPHKYMIMTINELAGLTHIPSTSDVSSDSVSWTDVAISGVLPPNAKVHEPLSVEERAEQLQRMLRRQQEIRDKYDITDEDTKLVGDTY